MARQRTEAERRARQCERFSRLIRILGLLMGAGRWDAAAMAQELECSQRTIFRDLQTLSMAGVPWYFDKESKAYRVSPGFRFAAVQTERTASGRVDAAMVLGAARQALQDGERFLNALRRFCSTLEGGATTEPD